METHNNDLRITLVQYSIEWEQPEKNIAKIEKLLAQQTRPSHLIVLPEMFNTGFSMDSARIATPMPSGVVQWMQQTATHTCSVVAGSVAVADNGCYYNRFMAVFPSGKIVYYDKRHLFRMSSEDKSYMQGNHQVVVDINGWRCALFVCYDLRFPVWLRNCNSYDLALFVANWPVSRIDVWNTLLKARAIENQCYVAGVNRTGSSNGIAYNGCSAVIDCRGNCVANLPENEEGLIEVELSLSDLNVFRDKFPVWMDADSFSLH